MVIQVIVNGVNGERMTIDVCERENELLTVTLLQLKQKIAMRLPGNSVSVVADMKLIFGGERMERDNKPLFGYGLEHRSTIQMVLTLDGGLTTQQRHWMDSPPQVPR